MLDGQRCNHLRKYGVQCFGIATALVWVFVELTAPAMALSDAECSELLGRNDVYSSGRLLEPFRQALVDSGRAVFVDGRVGRITVMIGCKSGAFDKVTGRRATDKPFRNWTK